MAFRSVDTRSPHLSAGSDLHSDFIVGHCTSACEQTRSRAALRQAILLAPLNIISSQIRNVYVN